MKDVLYKIAGQGAAQAAQAATVGELKNKLNLSGYTASVNGSAASDTQALTDGAYVTFSPAVKGG